MYNIKTFEPTIKYYDLVMTLDNLNNINEYPLPKGFYFKFWNNCKEIKDWIDIHISTGEFNQYKEATDTFKNFYGDFLPKLNRRLIFICDKTGNKVATATLSPHIEGDYKVVIDWFAIKKEFQGKKLSKPLLYKVVQIAKESGYAKYFCIHKLILGLRLKYILILDLCHIILIKKKAGRFCKLLLTTQN